MPISVRTSLAGVVAALCACAQPAPQPQVVYVQAPAGAEAPAPAAPAAPAATARVRVIHASPDPVAAHVAVYMDNGTVPVIRDLAYRTGVGYEPIGAGAHVVQARFPTAPPTTPPVLSYNTPSFVQDRWYTVIAHGLASEPQGPPVSFSPEEDPGAPLDSSRAAVRVFHAMVGAPTVDVCLGSLPLVRGVAYGQWSAGTNGRYALATPGAQQVTFRQHGSSPCSGRSLGGIQLNLGAGTNYTLVAIGRIARIGALAAQEVLVCNDAPLTAPSQCVPTAIVPM